MCHPRSMTAVALRTSVLAIALGLWSIAARADVVTDWNTTATSLLLREQFPPHTRIYSLMHTAVHDAVNAVERRYAPYAVDLKAPAGASIDAAAAGAAHAVLSSLMPAHKAAIDAALIASLTKMTDSQGQADGMAIGRQVAERLLALRADDGSAAKVEVQPATPGLGVWQLTPGWPAPTLTHLGKMKPMAIRSLSDFEMGGPPALTSERWIKDYNEVKAVGARNSTTRTADQTAAATLWGTAQSMLPWNAAAQAAARERKLGVAERARLFALLNIAAFDSAIAAFEQKFRYNFWRPYNAIRNPGGAGHPSLVSDPGWEPLLGTPAFPEYPSGHCFLAGAAAEVLRDLLGSDRVEATFTYPTQVGVTRTWHSFTEMEKESEDARVWAGVHYRTSDEHAIRGGRKVAQYAVKHILLPVASAAAN